MTKPCLRKSAKRSEPTGGGRDEEKAVSRTMTLPAFSLEIRKEKTRARRTHERIMKPTDSKNESRIVWADAGAVNISKGGEGSCACEQRVCICAVRLTV